jgi:hypothetical protein
MNTPPWSLIVKAARQERTTCEFPKSCRSVDIFKIPFSTWDSGDLLSDNTSHVA